jgi:pimeloyl-ACP methyl ester carboxylesterase
MPRRSHAILAAVLVLGLAGGGVALSQSTPSPKVRNVVLVHGAWADGSSWDKVIPILQAAGLKVTSVQNPLTSLGDAAAATRWALARQDGPTVLVGHSWSGTLVSEVGTDPKVTALVYVAARAPDAGEDFLALSATFATAPVRAGVESYDGLTILSEKAFVDDFANGLPGAEAQALFAVQQPTAAALFADRTSTAAWRTKPSYYAVSRKDRTITPDFERFLAKRMNATTIEVDAGHLSMVSHPQEIADLILEAAGVSR